MQRYIFLDEYWEKYYIFLDDKRSKNHIFPNEQMSLLTERGLAKPSANPLYS